MSLLSDMIAASAAVQQNVNAEVVTYTRGGESRGVRATPARNYRFAEDKDGFAVRGSARAFIVVADHLRLAFGDAGFHPEPGDLIRFGGDLYRVELGEFGDCFEAIEIVEHRWRINCTPQPETD